MLLNICADRFHSRTLIKYLLHRSTQTSNCKVHDLPGTKPNCISDNNIFHLFVNNSISLSLISLSRLYRSYILGGNFEKGLSTLLNTWTFIHIRASVYCSNGRKVSFIWYQFLVIVFILPVKFLETIMNKLMKASDAFHLAYTIEAENQ